MYPNTVLLFKIKPFSDVCVNSKFCGNNACISTCKIWNLNQMKYTLIEMTIT